MAKKVPIFFLSNEQRGKCVFGEFYFPIKIISEWKFECERHASPKPAEADILFQLKSPNNYWTCFALPLRYGSNRKSRASVIAARTHSKRISRWCE